MAVATCYVGKSVEWVNLKRSDVIYPSMFSRQEKKPPKATNYEIKSCACQPASKGNDCSGESECPEGGSRDGQNYHLVEVVESHQFFNTRSQV